MRDEEDENGRTDGAEPAEGAAAAACAESGEDDTPEGDSTAGPVDGERVRRLRSILESLLFAAGDPVTVGRLAQVVPGYEKREINRVLAALAEEYRDGERGMRLEQVAGGWQLRTSRANVEFVKALLQKGPVRMSRAALETLAVVAYRQPVTRPEIEAIRGVDVDAVLNGLVERRLLRVLGRKDVIGRPLLYGTTQEFLEAFGLKDLSALPTLEELGAPVAALEKAARAADVEVIHPEEGTPRAEADRGAQDVPIAEAGSATGGGDASTPEDDAAADSDPASEPREA